MASYFYSTIALSHVLEICNLVTCIKWQPTPVFLPGKSHGQRSLLGYSPWGQQRVRYSLVTKQQKQQIPSLDLITPQEETMSMFTVV